MATDIVSVQFMSTARPGEFVGREYTYYADQELKVGDCVAVPSRFGESLARVTAVGIPEYRVDPKILPVLRHITGSPVKAPKPLKSETPEQLQLQNK